MFSSSTPSRLLIRADAGPLIGTGHVMRCVALAQAWQHIGGTVDFVCGNLPKRLLKKLTDDRFNVFEVDRQDLASDARETSAIIEKNQPDWVVLDGYRFDDSYQSGLSLEPSTKLLAVDDFGHAAHHRADAILNQNVYASGDKYHSTNQQTDIITGPRFALLRDEFGASDAIASSIRAVPSQAKRTLVTFGGADPSNTTLDVLKALEQCPSSKKNVVDVVVGPCNPHIESLESFCRSSSTTVRLHRNIDRMSLLYDQVDFAITAGGSTCYELCRCGVPMLVVPIADNQIPVAQSLESHGIADVIYNVDSLLQKENVAKISGLIRSSNRRQEMAWRGRQLIDGRGATRLARRLAARLFRFRDATLEDTQLLLDWRNDPEIRAICFEDNVIPFNQHVQWFESKLKSRKTRIWIVEDQTQRPIGQIRLDFESNNRGIISINLIPSFRGKGMGTAFIERICRTLSDEQPNLEIVAQIKSTNIASQAAFRKAGFVAAATTTINDQVALQYVYQPESHPTQTIRHKKAC